MFWKTAERGRLDLFGRGLLLPADTSPPAEIYKYFFTESRGQGTITTVQSLSLLDNSEDMHE